jgi:hypothetical protein
MTVHIADMKRSSSAKLSASDRERLALLHYLRTYPIGRGLLLSVVACGDDPSAETEDGKGGRQESGSSKPGKHTFTGKGPAKSPAGRPIAAICGTTFDGCEEYFSADPEFGIARDVGGWCTSRDERCASEDIAGTCLHTKTTSFGKPYDIVEVYDGDDTHDWKKPCEKDGGTWTPGPTR